MQTRPFLLWLAATHAVALSACGVPPAEQELYEGYDLRGFTLVGPALMPGPGTLKGIEGTSTLDGFYALHGPGDVYQGYGELCGYDETFTGTPEILSDEPAPTSAMARIAPAPPETNGMPSGYTMLQLTCDPEPAREPEGHVEIDQTAYAQIGPWLDTIDSVQEAIIWARAQGHYLPSRPGGKVWYKTEPTAVFLAFESTDWQDEPVGMVLRVDRNRYIDRVDSNAYDTHTGGVVVGRLCTGVRLAEGHPGHTFAAYAGLEAAAAIAFDRMAEQLDHLGAPVDLIAACRAAADEERIHTALQTGLAADQGLQPVPVHVDPIAPVDLFTFALDNRLEGCIRETFGAMVGRFQADHLTPGRLRDVWQQIAADEEGHAALSWHIAAWAEAQLTAEQLAVLDARSEALLAGLVASHDAPAGLPVVPEAALRVYAQALRGRVLGRFAA